jgi:uncharacterized RDD family membrane protein YckC
MSQENQSIQSSVVLENALIKERVLGQLLEIALFFVPAALLGWLGLLSFGSEAGGKFFVGIYVVVFVIMQIRLILERSQTLGQYFFNIQVFDIKKNKRVGFWRYTLLRDFVGKTLVIGAIPIINLIFMPIYFIIDHLFIFKKDRRAVHDLVAGTRVIKLPTEQQRKQLFDFTRI